MNSPNRMRNMQFAKVLKYVEQIRPIFERGEGVR